MLTMSYRISPIDLSTLAVGQSGKIDLNAVKQKVAFDPAHASDPAHIRIFNESGSALSIASDAGTLYDYIPAGAWPTYELDQATSYITFTVLSILPSPPIQLLLPTYYVPGENVPDTPKLGNSPISIGGMVTTSSIQTLSNEGNASGQLVIDIGDTAFSQLLTIYTDGHCTWSVDQSGTKHQVIKINTSGNPLQLGQAGDTTEVLGALTIDQALTVTSSITANATPGIKTNTIADNVAGGTQLTLSNVSPQVTIANDQANNGHIILPNNKSIQMKSVAGAALDALYTDTGNGMNIQEIIAGAGVYVDAVTTATIAHFLTTGMLLNTLIELDSGVTIVNGSVGGNVTFRTPIWGNDLKVLIVGVNAFNSATIASFTFPTNGGQHMNIGVGYMGNLGATTWGLFIGSTAQTLAQVTSLGSAGTSGSSTGETALHGDNLVWWNIGTGPTSIQIGTTTQALTATGVFIGK